MMRLNRPAYAQLVAENLAWLEKQPQTLEREHIKLIVQASIDHEYPSTKRQNARARRRAATATALDAAGAEMVERLRLAEEVADAASLWVNRFDVAALDESEIGVDEEGRAVDLSADLEELKALAGQYVAARLKEAADGE